MRPGVVVTGASSGIGRATVDELVAHGFHVWATVRAAADEQALMEAHPDDVTVLRADLTDDAAVAALGAAVREAGPLHGLVDNAGVAVPAPLEHIPLDAFRHQIEVNLTAQLAVAQQVLPALRLSRRRGSPARIVVIGSIGGRFAGPVLGAYHASKFALVGLTDTLRAELAPAGIQVVLIEPGAVATPIWQRGVAAGDALLASLDDDARERYRAQIEAARAGAVRSAGRGVPPERVARVVRTALLARRPHARYLVGRDARIGATITRVSLGVARRLSAARA